MKNIILYFVFFCCNSYIIAQSPGYLNQRHSGLNYPTIECSELDVKIKVKKSPIILFCGDVSEKDKRESAYNNKKISGSLPMGSVDAKGEWKIRMRNALSKAKLNNNFSKEIVVYCGCCSSDNCPNVEPVILELKRLGYQNVKGLYFFEGYLPDWAGKKYAEESIK
jgi:hypothetical protein